MKHLVLLASGLALALSASASAGTNAPKKVPGTANPFYAGRTATGSNGGNDDGTVPPSIPITYPATSVLGFKVTGGASYVSSCCDPLDGDGPYDMTDLDDSTGIAGVNGGRPSALVGVFLGNGTPQPPAPARLNFNDKPDGIGIAFASIKPKLNQIFFIGDGRKGDGTGAMQQFVVPAGATRLFFGVDDGSGWYDNSGQITVTTKLLATP